MKKSLYILIVSIVILSASSFYFYKKKKTGEKNYLKGLNGTLENDLERFVKKALANSNFSEKFKIGYVSKNLANKIKKVLDVDTYEFELNINANDVRHIFRKHSDESAEYKKGQKHISINDLKKMPKLLTEPSVIRKGEKENFLEFRKVVDTEYFLIVELHVKNKYIIVKTYYKKK